MKRKPETKQFFENIVDHITDIKIQSQSCNLMSTAYLCIYLL